MDDIKFLACAACGGVFKRTPDWHWWTKNRQGKKIYFCGSWCYRDYLIRQNRKRKKRHE